ncbi:MAG: FIST N-terminal domain-containing protein [Candidatus Aenigmatarchaeota archaeon]
MEKIDFKAVVEISREWEGEKVAKELVLKIKSKTPNPKFILLFTTIHYEKEFKKILSGMKDAFPQSPLIGGTIAGFMTPEGCFTRGVTALTVEYSDVDVSIGIGNDTKKNYKDAVSSALNDIKKKKNKNHNSFIIELLPSATIPSIVGVGQKNVILSDKIAKKVIDFLPLASKLNMGSDKADEIIEALSKKTSDIIIGGCTMDDNKLLRNYQFHDKDILNNSLCLLKVSTGLKLNLYSVFGFQPMNKEIHITKIDDDRRVVSEIDHKKARTTFLNLFGWKESDLGELYQLYRRVFYYPFGYKKDNYWHPCMIGLIWGENLIFANKIKEKKLKLLSLSAYRLIKNLNQFFSKEKFSKSKLVFGIGCETFIETLRDSIYDVKEIISKEIKEKPFLIIFTAGESVCNVDRIPHHFYESLNLLSIG